MKKSYLVEYVNKAIELRREYIAVIVQTEGLEGEEIIINRTNNFVPKLKYYKNAYNDNMVKIDTPIEIKITGVVCGDTYKELSDSIEHELVIATALKSCKEEV